MYIKNVSYESENPFPMKPTLVMDTTKASLEKETSGEFAGAYKYTNTSLGRANGDYGASGVHFGEIFNQGSGYNRAFADAGYQYVKLDFYATESVHSIELQMSFTAGANWIQKLIAKDATPGSGEVTTFTSESFMIYDQDGNQVNSWTANKWYTLIIKPGVEAQGGWTYPLRITTNAKDANSTAPVMYIKDATYLVTNPYI